MKRALKLVASLGVTVLLTWWAFRDTDWNGQLESLRDYSLALDAPVKLGRTVVPAHADVHLTDKADGTKQVDAAARLSRHSIGSTWQRS